MSVKAITRIETYTHFQGVGEDLGLDTRNLAEIGIIVGESLNNKQTLYREENGSWFKYTCNLAEGMQEASYTLRHNNYKVVCITLNDREEMRASPNNAPLLKVTFGNVQGREKTHYDRMTQSFARNAKETSDRRIRVIVSVIAIAALFVIAIVGIAGSRGAFAISSSGAKAMMGVGFAGGLLITALTIISRPTKTQIELRNRSAESALQFQYALLHVTGSTAYEPISFINNE